MSNSILQCKVPPFSAKSVSLSVNLPLLSRVNHLKEDRLCQGKRRDSGHQQLYEEYAKSYGSLGKTQQGLDYVDLAGKVRPPTKSSEILLKVARAEILIRSGDIRNGESLAIEAAIYCREHGHYRRLERIYVLKRYLNEQILRYGKTELALSEALEGPIEQ